MAIARLAGVAAVVVAASTLASPAFAQPYIGALLVGDVVRLDQYDSRTGDSGNGEALGFALRLGGPIGARWGVELELVRPGEITSDQTPEIFPLPYYTLSAAPIASGLPSVLTGSSLTLPYSYRFRSTQRRTTLSTALWVRQEITRRFSLAYVGGLSFGRTNNLVEFSYLPLRPVILPAPFVTESITYEVGPMVGVEGRIRMVEQLDLVPGLRLHGIEAGWMIRPALGLAWTF